jgi:hypothetical protein
MCFFPKIGNSFVGNRKSYKRVTKGLKTVTIFDYRKMQPSEKGFCLLSAKAHSPNGCTHILVDFAGKYTRLGA